MKIDLSAIDLFRKYYSGAISSADLLCHPAYQTILRHARLVGDSFAATDIDQALRHEDSAFKGLAQIHERLPAVLQLADHISQVQAEWVDTAERELGTLLPGESLDHIVVFPVIGYDIGIGLNGRVAMNINHRKYLSDPNEFLYYMIHEATHVLFEPHHSLPDIGSVSTQQEWSDLLLWALHYEGFATYAPLRLRLAKQHTQDSDYTVLTNHDLLASSIRMFLEAKRTLDTSLSLTDGQRLNLIYGPERTCYRVGCELVRRIHTSYGQDAVTQGAYLDARVYWERYGQLLNDQ